MYIDDNTDEIAERAASDWFTINPKHRTKDRLFRHIKQALNESYLDTKYKESEFLKTCQAINMELIKTNDPSTT